MAMARPSGLKKIEKQLENLSVRDQRKLVEQLSRRLRQAKSKRGCLDWAKLYGLGKGLWDGEDAQAYVDRLREDRV